MFWGSASFQAMGPLTMVDGIMSSAKYQVSIGGISFAGNGGSKYPFSLSTGQRALSRVQGHFGFITRKNIARIKRLPQRSYLRVVLERDQEEDQTNESKTLKQGRDYRRSFSTLE